MFVFRKIWRGLLSCYFHFEIRPFTLLPTHYRHIGSSIYDRQQCCALTLDKVYVLGKQ